jgi:hypothetical protein
MTRVALYARYSSDNQRDASIEDQLRICRENAEREKWTVVSTYKDAGISGASMILRPGIQTLLQDAQRQQFDVVLAEALDRISRDQADVATLFKHLRFAGVPIITLRYALVRTAEKSTPPYTANWARSSDGSKHKPSQRLGNATIAYGGHLRCTAEWVARQITEAGLKSMRLCKALYCTSDNTVIINYRD